MKVIRNILYTAALLVLGSCSQDRIGTDQPEGTPVRLSAIISALNETVVTKADDKASTQVTASAYLETTPSESAPLTADLYFSSSTQTFSSAGHRTISYISDSFTFPDPIGGYLLEYDTDESKSLYCVGFAPKEKWDLTFSGTTATSKAGLVDGVTDLMYAEEISGSKNSKFSVQTFNHALTWIKVRVRAKTTTAPATWGELHKITINSKDQADVDFSDGSISWKNSTTNANGVEIVAFDNSEGVVITTESSEYGSVFVAPVPATATGATLNFSITTDLWGGSGDVQHNPKTATVHLLDNNGNAVTTSTAGQLYVVTLIFTDLATVDAEATLENWVDENRDGYSAQAEFANVNVTDGSTSESGAFTEVVTATSSVTTSIVSSNANIGCSATNNEGSIHVKIYDNGANTGDTATVTLSLMNGSEIYKTKIYNVTVVAL